MRKKTKRSFIIINVLLLIFAMLTVASGIFLLIVRPDLLFDDMTAINNSNTVYIGLTRLAGYALVAGGGAMVLLTVIGIVGAVRESVCLLRLYLVLFVMAVTLQVAAFVSWTFLKILVVMNMQNDIMQSVKNNTGPKNIVSYGAICCGYSGVPHQRSEDDGQWNETHPDNFGPIICCLKRGDCGGGAKSVNSTTFYENDPCSGSTTFRVFQLQTTRWMYKYFYMGMFAVSVLIVTYQVVSVWMGVLLISQRKLAYERFTTDLTPRDIYPEVKAKTATNFQGGFMPMEGEFPFTKFKDEA